VQRSAGANEKAERAEQRDDDGQDESRLSENVRNLNRHNVSGVFNRTGRMQCAMYSGEHVHSPIAFMTMM